MDEVSVVVHGGNNISDNTWWLDIVENEATVPIPLDGSEGGLWSGNFVPPPPRPLFLEETISPDGLTTCDLCTWAWKNSKTFTLDATLGTPGKVEWVLTLVIVSLISAVVGAVVMVIALYCRRMKNAVSNDSANTSNSVSISLQPIEAAPDNKSTHPSLPDHNGSKSLWHRVFKKSQTAPSQLNALPTSTNENHYTHMDETYNVTDEALYAELDQYSNSPAYQNSGYADPDIPPSSAPSSAYYSDLSVNTTNNDRTYEIIGLAAAPVWDSSDPLQRVKLSAISETVTVPSDYV
ncbi:hypothetical protein RN001_009706 [Aquatica leii]|uniref:Uncharacterized protein n=1 Tax=Aquatica leii TaxID=1421715 RepID=A0AAN7SQ16_9COLE|nr:hypothetical protein RN001_009706 [Aquatica leii]